MTPFRISPALGFLAAAATLGGAAASIWPQHLDALLGTGSRFAELAPWITGGRVREVLRGRLEAQQSGLQS
jgi:hypothetical protein